MLFAALCSTLLALTRPHMCDEWPVAAPTVAAPQAAAVAPPRPVPSALSQAERTRYRVDYGVLEMPVGIANVVVALTEIARSAR